MCTDRHARREECICVGRVAILEYVNQLEKYTRPDFVEDDRRCDQCGARLIDTQEQVTKVMESDSYFSDTSADVEKSPARNESDSMPSCDKDMVPTIAFGKRSDPKLIQSTTDQGRLVMSEDRKKSHTSTSVHASTVSGTIMSLGCGIQCWSI